jgi:uncharacterized membrane protein YwzB
MKQLERSLTKSFSLSPHVSSLDTLIKEIFCVQKMHCIQMAIAYWQINAIRLDILSHVVAVALALIYFIANLI